MNARALIHHALDGGRNERLPRALFGGGLWAYAQAGLLPEALGRDHRLFADALSGLYRDLGTDILFLGSGLNSFPAESVGGILRFSGPEAPLLARPLIGSAADLRRAGTVDLQRSPRVAALARMIEEVRANLPERFICATTWGPFTWAMILCDHDLLREKLRVDRPFVTAVADLGVRLSASWFDLLAGRGLVDGVLVPDGAATLISPEDYRELVLPPQRELFARARARSLRTILHMCGQTRPQLPLYLGAGAECISVDGHVAAGEAYELYHATTVTAGNVEAVEVIAAGEMDTIRAAVAACVGQIADPGLRYILMPSCDLPVGTPRRNVEAFLDAADAWRTPAVECSPGQR